MFCLNYYPQQKELMKQADQIKINYTSIDRSFQHYLKQYSDKTVIFNILSKFQEWDAKFLSELSEKYKNLKVIINFENKEYYNLIKKYNIPFFFSNFVTTIDQLNGFIEYHPTDMYICEQLGFHLDKINKLLHDNNIKIRVFPNICQSSFSETPSIKTFFIRPEDINIYSVFVDTFELVSDKERQPVLFKIYKQGKWFGPIKEIIPSFKDELDSRFLLNQFGVIRSKCGKRCMYKKGSCKICDNLIQLGEVLKENNIMIIRKNTES